MSTLIPGVEEEAIKLELELQEKIEKEKVKGLIDVLLLEDKFARDIVIRINKKLELYFKGYQRLFWSASLGDWMSPSFPGFDQGLFTRENPEFTELPDDTTKIFNVYRAYGESVISALASGVPATKFFPENADSVEDIITAKAFSRIAKLIEKQNDASLLFTKVLYYLWNQHYVAAYTYANADEKYGTNQREVMGMVDEPFSTSYCPNCGNENLIQEETGTICPECGPVEPIVEEGTEQIEQVTGFEKIPKIREIIEIYGSLNVQIPSYAFDIKGCPYLRLNVEIHEDLAKSLFPEIADKIGGHPDTGELDRWSRAAVELSRGAENKLCTLSRTWMRTWTVKGLNKEDPWIETLEKKYPDGFLVYQVDDLIARIEPENLDDHWTITRSPLSPKLHAEPLGLNLIDVQDVVNELVNIETQTISYGIGETFVDPEVINFRDYKKNKSQPGMLTAATPAPGKSLADSFHTIKSATLSREVEDFQGRLEQYGQFISGAYPSIYGGSMQGGSKTLGEYQDSRAQALQRLSLVWKMLNAWWPLVIEKATREYAENLKTEGFDEHFVEANGDDFLNVWIKVAELTGKVGDVRSESSEQLPVSWAQRRGMILEFLNMKNPIIDPLLVDPSNSTLVAETLGWGEVYIPGADDRNVQLEEIKQLISSGPVMQPQMDQFGQPAIDQMSGQPLPPVPTSSVPIQPVVDNHQVHAQTCRAWLNSAVGRAMKQMNPPAYENVVLHLQQHDAIVQQMMMQSQQTETQEQM